MIAWVNKHHNLLEKIQDILLHFNGKFIVCFFGVLMLEGRYISYYDVTKLKTFDDLKNKFLKNCFPFFTYVVKIKTFFSSILLLRSSHTTFTKTMFDMI